MKENDTWKTKISLLFRRLIVSRTRIQRINKLKIKILKIPKTVGCSSTESHFLLSKRRNFSSSWSLKNIFWSWWLLRRTRLCVRLTQWLLNCCSSLEGIKENWRKVGWKEKHPKRKSSLFHCQDESQSLMRSAMAQLNLSAWAYHRILKLARTIADLAASEDIQSVHMTEVLHLRPSEVVGWMRRTISITLACCHARQ